MSALACDAEHPHTGARCTLLPEHHPRTSHEGWGTWPATGRSGWVRWWSEPEAAVGVGAGETPDRLAHADQHGDHDRGPR